MQEGGDKQMNSGAYLKNLREQNSMTQTELADLLDISLSYISKLETNKRLPSKKLISKYSEAFEVPVNEIFFAVTRTICS